MSIWSPVWSVKIDNVEYKDVTLANLTIASGRTDIYSQAVAGYCNLTLINFDDSLISLGINSAVTVYVKDTNNVNVALFGGSVTDVIVGVQSGGSIGMTQTVQIVAVGALARLPKVLTDGVLTKAHDGDQIYSILEPLLFNTWNEVPAALSWANYDPTVTWANAENSGLGEIDRPGNYELTSRSASTTDVYSLVSALATSGLGYLYENAFGQISYADSTHRSTYLSTNGYVDLSANDAFAGGLETALRAGDVRNNITLSYKANAQVSASDANSIAEYGTLAQSITTSLENAADATSQANFYLTLRAWPRANFNQISFPLGSPEIDNSDRNNMLNVFMGMPVTINDLPANMGERFQGFVEGWQFQAGVNSLTLSMYLSPVEFSLQAMKWSDVSVTEAWNTLSNTLIWDNAFIVN
ncbi:MAG: hypothetical protein EBT51_11415 [Flavobacteriaceae bacterium]|nr:hypothetical protein [Flavobacteriaceae bacterium]